MANLIEVVMPSEAYENEKEILFVETFPSEVWNTIFERLAEKKSEVLETCSKASPVLRDLLAPQQTLFLFPKVLSLLMERERNEKARLKLYLSARAVCRGWCDAAENLEEDKVSLMNPQYRIPYPAQSKSEDEFYAHFMATYPPRGSRNPFIGNSIMQIGGVNCRMGSLILGEMDGRRVDKLFGDFYGQRIKHLYWRLNSDEETQIAGLLEHLPNLESLGFESSLFPEDLIVGHGQLHRLPVFQNLHFLKFVNISVEFLGALLTKTPNLVNLQVTAQAISALEGLLVPVVAPLPHLEHLTIETQFASYGRVSDIREPFRTLEAHAGLQITTLDLYLPFNMDTAYQMHRIWRRRPFHLPRLRKLRLYSESWPCLDFLMAFRETLQELWLEVSTRDSPNTNRKESVEYLGYCFDNMEYSSIWKQLPRLSELSVLQYSSLWMVRELLEEGHWTRDATSGKVHLVNE